MFPLAPLTPSLARPLAATPPVVPTPPARVDHPRSRRRAWMRFVKSVQSSGGDAPLSADRPAAASEQGPPRSAGPQCTSHGRLADIRASCSADTGAALARWDDVLERLACVVSERHSYNRRGKIAALRRELQSIEASLPEEVAACLEAELIHARAEASRQQKDRMQQALNGQGPTVVIDCGFAEEHCREGLERRSLAKQVEWAMAVNRRSERPVGLHATGWQGEVAAFGTYIGCAGWPVVLHDKPLLQVFPAERIIVLSPDAEAPLTTLSESDVYVIGGIVDRTIRKGVTASFAAEQGLRCARLPIAEHAAALGMDAPGVRSSPVLNVSDVAIALIEAHRTQGDWVAALDRVIPARKRRPQQDRVKRPRGAEMAGKGP